MYSLLLVEDDLALRSGLEMLFTEEGYVCFACASVEDAEHVLVHHMPDLCVLDRQLPGASGDALCKRLRKMHPAMPILMLSARSRSKDTLDGLKAGADDYMTKPFAVDELIARVAVMRRRLPYLRHEVAPAGFMFGDRRVDPLRLQVQFPQGESQQISVRDLHLLELLWQRAGVAVTRDELYNRGWGYAHLPNSRALDQYMVGLRMRLRDSVDSKEALIVSVRGVGYRYAST